MFISLVLPISIATIFALNLHVGTCILIILLGLFSNILSLNYSHIKNKEFLIVLCLFSTWLYGLMSGMIQGNQSDYVLRNFFCLALYPLIYFWIISFKTINFNNMIVYPAYIIIFISLCLLINLYVFPEGLLISYFADKLGDGYLGEGNLRVYYIGVILINGFLGYQLWKFGASINRINTHSSLFMIIFIILIFSLLTQSKGFVPAILGFTFFIFLYSSLFSIKSKVVVVMVLLSGIIFANFEGYNLLNLIAGEEMSGNNLRYTQMDELINDFSLFGKGLGSVIENGYARSDEFPYGYELSYLNLIHKFGLGAAIIFSTYIYVLYRSIVLMAIYPNVPNGYVAFGLMGYLIPSIGNPIILSIQAVIAHVIAILLVAFPSRNYFQDKLFKS